MWSKGYFGNLNCGCGDEVRYIGIYESRGKGYTRSNYTLMPYGITTPAYMDINARYRSVPVPYHVYIPYAQREDAGRKNRGCKLPKKRTTVPSVSVGIRNILVLPVTGI